MDIPKDDGESKVSFRRYRKYEKGEFYVVGADTAAGGGDYCTAQFICKDKIDVPTVYHSPNIVTEMTPLIHQELEKIYDETGVQPVVAFETNNGGLYEMERLAALNRNGKYRLYLQKTGVGTQDTTNNTKKYGFTTSSATRSPMLALLKDAIDNELITIYDEPTITEMFSFVEVQTSSIWKAQAEVGAHDDLIMALAIAWQLYQTEKPAMFSKRTTRKPPPKTKFHVR